MKTSALGRAALEAREGCRLSAYQDSVGVWTIGYGHTSAAGQPKVIKGLKIDQTEADTIFSRDLVKYEATVQDVITVPMADHQFDALVSICYNIGQGAFAKATFPKNINAKASAATIRKNIEAYRKPAEIIPRRQAEADQFFTPYSTALPKARSSDKIPIKGVSVVPTPSPKPVHPTLSKGDKGNEVRVMQVLLNVNGPVKVTPDGDFGPKTEAAVRSFQAKAGLVVDGRVGPLTWTALGY